MIRFDFSGFDRCVFARASSFSLRLACSGSGPKPVGGHSPRQSAGRLSTVPAERLGRRSAASSERRRPCGHYVPDQARDRLAAVAPGCGGWCAAGRGTDGPGLWQRQQTACWDQRTRAHLRGRHPAHHDGLAARRGTVAACDQIRPRPTRRPLRRDGTHRPVSAKTLALELAAEAWQQITWRDGSNTPLSSRFARWRVRPAHDDARRSEPAAEEWLLIEWPEGEAEPDHYWFSTLPADISLESMVDQAKLRWRIERDYLELKQEVGLGHYEGRGWRGFHHHATLCIAAYGFLISEKETIPPSGPARARRRSQSAVPAGYRHRGSAAAVTTPYAEFHRHAAYPPRAHTGAGPATVPLLRTATAERRQAERVTQ